MYRSALETIFVCSNAISVPGRRNGQTCISVPGRASCAPTTHHRLPQLLSDPALSSLVERIAFFMYLEDELNVILHTCDGSTARLLSESSASLRTCVGSNFFFGFLTGQHSNPCLTLGTSAFYKSLICPTNRAYVRYLFHPSAIDRQRSITKS